MYLTRSAIFGMDLTTYILAGPIAFQMSFGFGLIYVKIHLCLSKDALISFGYTGSVSLSFIKAYALRPCESVKQHNVGLTGRRDSTRLPITVQQKKCRNPAADSVMDTTYGTSITECGNRVDVRDANDKKPNIAIPCRTTLA
ncbi:unnamed protein product [Ilex paraguariensis]|uniref:Uncharacterized protein n=1 Tax=Ilex paraguariensis TaxID=185542 RepID=A0ABC8UEK3_9AQUA